MAHNSYWVHNLASVGTTRSKLICTRGYIIHLRSVHSSIVCGLFVYMVLILAEPIHAAAYVADISHAGASGMLPAVSCARACEMIHSVIPHLTHTQALMNDAFQFKFDLSCSFECIHWPSISCCMCMLLCIKILSIPNGIHMYLLPPPFATHAPMNVAL